MVDVDVADLAQACTLYMLYFQAETTVRSMIVGSNSESDTEDVRSRKVYTTPLARAKGNYTGKSPRCTVYVGLAKARPMVTR